MVNFKTIIVVAIAGIALILGVAAYNVLRTPATASAPLQAIPIAANTTESSNPTTAAQPTASAVSPSVAATTAPAATAAPAVASPAEALATDTPASESGSTLPSGSIVAQIVADESEARFVINEVLNNAPKTVIGTTNQVAGELAVDPSDPTKSQVGVIQVNARTLATDSDFRNRAIKNQILQTDQYELITFTPKKYVGLPTSGAVGQSYSFQIVGDLTIRDVTREVTFDVTATPASADRLEGTAQTTIRYADYGITIPQVRQVASVDEQVRLEIDFVAVPKS
jgi:polyisoprenoid-binding protein YceI